MPRGFTDLAFSDSLQECEAGADTGLKLLISEAGMRSAVSQFEI
jgi:hypothetical protein